jgi:tRNA(Ile)-lysidine synthase
MMTIQSAPFTSTNPTLVDRLLRAWPIEHWRCSRLLVAVSGGADSVALVRALHHLCQQVPGTELTLAHFNHGWRAEESDADEAFVVRLAKLLNLPVVVQRANRPLPSSAVPSSFACKNTGPSVRSEDRARKSRYEFLQKTAIKLGCSWLLTGHTASDRVETLLHNLCRGSGIAGLCVPAVQRPLGPSLTLVRPLIDCFREDVIAYLDLIQQEFRQDSSNDNTYFRRNFIRRRLLPLLAEAYGPQVEQRLFCFSQLAQALLSDQRQLSVQYLQQARSLQQQSAQQGWLSADSPMRGLWIPSCQLLPATWSVVCLALQHQWAERSWALQGMSHVGWNRVAQVWSNLQRPTRIKLRRPKRLFQLPGPIQVASCNGWLLFQSLRPQGSPVQPE